MIQVKISTPPNTKSKINVLISEPVEVSPGVFKTFIMHPKLDGELSFVHGRNNRDQTLSVLQNSIVEDIKEIVEDIQNMVSSGKAKK